MTSQRAVSGAIATRGHRAARRRPARLAHVISLAVFGVVASWHAATAGKRLAMADAASPLVPLASVAPDIVEDMRYATPRNFTGHPVPGYEAPVCWLRPAVAKALARVQADLAGASPPLSLAVLDCYRPRRSVAAFMSWARARDDGSTRHYHPSLARRALVPRGYIAASSTHSRGIAVDLTVVARTEKAASRREPSAADRAACTDAVASAAETGLDMGTTFDCFDAKSHTANAALTPAQRDARQTLKRAMERHGFTNYAKEWWHFTYAAADDGRSFDIPVTAPK